jgi:Ca-activated chloride channel family protein
MANELNLVATLNKPAVPVTSTQQLIYVLVQVKPSEVVARSRMKLNFGFALDHSGSMRGAKIDRLKEAVALALGRMAADDRVSVTIFNDSAEVIAPNGTVADHGSLGDRVQRIRAGGGTQMSRGMSLGLREVYRQFDANVSNQLLLLTDGQTYGDEAQCRKLAKESGEHKIAIQALGLGDDWNENLLDEIGSLSAGGSDLIETADEIVPLFTQTVERSQKAVIRNAAMTLRLVSGVVPRQVCGR